MTDISVSPVRFGIPEFVSRKNGTFSLGRKTAESVAAAGPGHYAAASFGVDETSKISTFISGARYVTKSNPNIQAKRRKVDASTIMIYVVNQPTNDSNPL